MATDHKREAETAGEKAEKAAAQLLDNPISDVELSDWQSIGYEAIIAAFEAEAALRQVAEWQAHVDDCPEFDQPEGWEDIGEHICRGYADEHEDAQFVCEQTEEQCAECWFKYWIARAKERKSHGDR